MSTLTIFSRDQGPKWQPQWDDRRDLDAGRNAEEAHPTIERRVPFLWTWLPLLRPLRGV